jgi:hypothetical protein
MKKRTNFVSNSSSSSFIIGFGIVKDKSILEKFLKNNKIEMGYNLKILRKDEILKEYEKSDISASNETYISIPSLSDKEIYFIAEISNNEGDQHFYSEYEEDDDCYELNYSPAFKKEFFSKSQQAIIDLFSNKNIIKKGIVKFGAERNG